MYYESFYAFLVFWLYPVVLELLLNIWGFWASSQPYDAKTRIKSYHFPIVYHPSYQFHSYCNLEWKMHHIDWRTSRTVFHRL